MPPPQNQPQGINAMRPQPFPAPPRDPFGRPNPLHRPDVPYDPNVGERAPQAPPLTPPGIDLGGDLPPMQPRNPMDRPMPQVPQGPMTIPNPQSGPVSTGPFGSPYDPQSPNTPNLPRNQMPRPPVRNPLDTGVDYEPPGPTQIPYPGSAPGTPNPRPSEVGPPDDPFNRDHRGLDGKFPTMPQASMSQGPEPQAAMPRFGQQGYADMIRQRRQQQGSPSSLQGLRDQAQGGRGLPNQVKGGGVVGGVTYGKSGAPQMSPDEIRQRQIQSGTQQAQDKFLRDKHGAVGNERLGQLRSQYQASGQTQPQTSQFQRDQQGQTRDSYGTRMSRIPQQPTQPPAPKPTGPTTVNLRTPNQGMQQQFTPGQKSVLGSTIRTNASKANAMRRSASRYQPRAGLRTTANRAKPRTSLPQLYGN